MRIVSRDNAETKYRPAQAGLRLAHLLARSQPLAGLAAIGISSQISVEVFGKRFGRRVAARGTPFPGIFRKSFPNRARHARPQLANTSRLFRRNFSQYLDVAVALKQRLAGQHFIEYCAQGIDVARRTNFFRPSG